MDGGNAKTDASRFLVREVDDFLTDGWLIQKAELAPRNLRGDADAGLSVQLIIVGEPVLGENFENGETALAAKIMCVRRKARGQAFVAAVETMRSRGRVCSRRGCELFNHKYCAKSPSNSPYALSIACG